MTIIELLLLVLGTWGTVWLLVHGSGPGAILARFREKVGVRYDMSTGIRYGETWIGELFNCPVCLSVWVSPLLLIILLLGWWQLVAVLAAVGGVEIITMLGDR
jgi:hypothetical protein